MPNNHEPTPATDALKALARFLHEPETANIPSAEIRSELKRAAFDTHRVKADFQQALDKAKGRARLAAARTKLTPLLAQFEELRGKLAGVSDVKAAARQILNEVFGGTAQAEMYCRKFEELSDEDARSMIEDSTFLNDIIWDDPDAKA